jgi:hypothetical protein
MLHGVVMIHQQHSCMMKHRRQVAFQSSGALHQGLHAAWCSDDSSAATPTHLPPVVTPWRLTLHALLSLAAAAAAVAGWPSGWA